MKTLASRIFAILLVATVAIQIFSFGGVLIFNARDSRQQMYEFMAADVLFLHRFLAALDPTARAAWIPPLDRGFYVPTLVSADADLPLSTDRRLLATAAPLQRRLGPGIAVHPVMQYDELGHLPAIAVALDRHHSLLIRFPDRRPPFSPPPLGVIAAYVAAVSLAVMLAAWFGVRLATRPLQRFAEAARGLARDLDAPPLPELGPTEVTQASRAFNAMQAELQKNLAERTRILASISHDLKTPLTRLRLRVGALSPATASERERIESDLDAMQALVQEGLDYARSERLDEARVPSDLNAMVDSIAEQAEDTGHPILVAGRLAAPVLCAPRALQRALQNLADNAVKYGGATTLRLMQDDGWTEIRIEDCGPGIPEELLERVFEPFFRIEDSRNRHTGGTGLGLTIARNLICAQGGTLHLENRPGGGVVAVLRLPRSLPSGGCDFS